MGYSVKVDDKEVASVGQFGSEESKTFEVGSSTPTTPSPSTSAPVPAPTPPPTPPPTPVTSSSVFPSTAAPVPTPDATPYPTGTAPTLYPTGVPPTTCGVKGDTCTKHKQCCGKKCNLKKNTCRK